MCALVVLARTLKTARWLEGRQMRRTLLSNPRPLTRLQGVSTTPRIGWDRPTRKHGHRPRSAAHIREGHRCVQWCGRDGVWHSSPAEYGWVCSDLVAPHMWHISRVTAHQAQGDVGAWRCAALVCGCLRETGVEVYLFLDANARIKVTTAKPQC